MIYFVYRIHPSNNPIVKQLDKLGEFEQFKLAKEFVLERRANQAETDKSEVKIIFAKNELEAEENLQEKRETPILREWEK